MQIKCEVCGNKFKIYPYEIGKRKTCSRSCRGVLLNRYQTEQGKRYAGPRDWLIGNKHAEGHVPVNGFQKGHTPWMKIHGKGKHFSPDTEFKPGMKPINTLAVGTETIRVDKNGKHRSFTKINEPNVWKEKAIIVWESIHGPLQKGYVVHHKDQNTLNDAPQNLEALTRSAHLKKHVHQYLDNRWHQKKKA